MLKNSQCKIGHCSWIKLLFAWLVFVPSLLTRAQEATFKQQDQQWVQDYFQLKLGEKWSVSADGGFRWKNTFAEKAQYIARTSLHYKFSENWKLGFGGATSVYYTSNEISKSEWRIFFELGREHKRNNLVFQTRYRFEERFFSTEDVTGNTTRSTVLRNRFSAGISYRAFNFGKKPYECWIYFGDELFINFPVLDAGYFFDQNRILVGPVLKLSRGFSMQLLYNFQLAGNFKTNSYNITHITWLSFRQTIQYKKRSAQ